MTPERDTYDANVELSRLSPSGGTPRLSPSGGTPPSFPLGEAPVSQIAPETPATETSVTEAAPPQRDIDRELQILAERDAAERKRLRQTLVGAALFHAVLLLVTFPSLVAEPKGRPRKVSEVYVVQQVRFKPPAPQQREIPKRKVKKIPIPDPTPDEPEPLEIEDLTVPEVDLPPTDAAVFGIPDAPAEGSGVVRGDVLQVGDGVTAPEKLFAPQPRYSEDARKGRIQGVVILQAIVDAMGNVSKIEVLKGLPLGLTESAIETVQEWQYKPATMNGQPVAVYLNLLINFSLQ